MLIPKKKPGPRQGRQSAPPGDAAAELESLVNTPNERRDDHESFGGARKLIRPLISAVTRRRHDPSHSGDPLTHALVSDTHGVPSSSHAEAFYFQKQIQQQTEMTVVLDDSEEIHGVIEWYDRCSLKLRAGRHRVLIYKSAIKYLYKTSDAHTAGTVMK